MELILSLVLVIAAIGAIGGGYYLDKTHQGGKRQQQEISARIR